MLSDKTALLWGTLSLTSPTQGTLSEKLPYSRFSQVPAGSDSPCSKAILHESKTKSAFASHPIYFFLKEKSKERQVLLLYRTENIVVDGGVELLL